MSSKKVEALFSGEPPPAAPATQTTGLLLILSFALAFPGLLLFAAPLAIGCAIWAYYRCSQAQRSPLDTATMQRVERQRRLAQWAVATSGLALMIHSWLLQQDFYRLWLERLLERVFL